MIQEAAEPRPRAKVAAVLAGPSLRDVARTFRVSLPTVQRWVARAGRRRPDRVEWSAQPPIAHPLSQTPPEVEERVLSLRRGLCEDRARQALVGLIRSICGALLSTTAHADRPGILDPRLTSWDPARAR